ncbi:hypothetical protein KM043_005481 [Ampulex compressa]|nr:hypothetical protein KM043_005481 [Ampulex compressa]
MEEPAFERRRREFWKVEDLVLSALLHPEVLDNFMMRNDPSKLRGTIGRKIAANFTTEIPATARSRQRELFAPDEARVAFTHGQLKVRKGFVSIPFPFYHAVPPSGCAHTTDAAELRPNLSRNARRFSTNCSEGRNSSSKRTTLEPTYPRDAEKNQKAILNLLRGRTSTTTDAENEEAHSTRAILLVAANG